MHTYINLSYDIVFIYLCLLFLQDYTDYFTKKCPFFF